MIIFKNLRINNCFVCFVSLNDRLFIKLTTQMPIFNTNTIDYRIDR
jgi:hypothetical protein